MILFKTFIDNKIKNRCISTGSDCPGARINVCEFFTYLRPQIIDTAPASLQKDAAIHACLFFQLYQTTKFVESDRLTPCEDIILRDEKIHIKPFVGQADDSHRLVFQQVRINRQQPS